MVNVNKNLLNKKDEERLLKQLDTTVSKLSAVNTTVFFDEILGKEERLTVAKRLAAIVLLVEGYSQYKTAKLLKLSPSTTEKISNKIEIGAYQGILRILGKSKTDYFAILKVIDSVLHLGGILPHYNGLDRYRGIR